MRKFLILFSILLISYCGGNETTNNATATSTTSTLSNTSKRKVQSAIYSKEGQLTPADHNLESTCNT